MLKEYISSIAMKPTSHAGQPNNEVPEGGNTKRYSTDKSMMPEKIIAQKIGLSVILNKDSYSEEKNEDKACECHLTYKRVDSLR